MAITDFIDPLYALDAVAGAWAKATYNTPFQTMPVFGIRSNLNPLGRAYRKAYALGEFEGQPKTGFFTNWAPMTPASGPPLPKMLDIKWPKLNTKES